jgi:glycerol-3-phosphate acyltransferase PlsY|uniref:Glycerol-3-phosphate acyltransferase n=1 Tax=Desulfobacca acetoxidans TaxID=60893 RepID=A0A7C3V651_9BACT
MNYFLGLVGLAYLLGSVPTGLLVARLMGGPDPRQAGSGNLGAANLYRLLGRNAGVFTFLGDALKGAVPVFLAVYWLTPLGAWYDSAVAGVGLAAVLGHIFSVFLKFQGGKAVATAFGVIAVLCPAAALNLVVVYAIALYQVRIFSVAALICAWLLPLAVGLFCNSKAYLFLAGILSGLVLVRHRENLVRLARGEEPRL